jgi:hypothetical protein
MRRQGAMSTHWVKQRIATSNWLEVTQGGANDHF